MADAPAGATGEPAPGRLLGAQQLVGDVELDHLRHARVARPVGVKALGELAVGAGGLVDGRVGVEPEHGVGVHRRHCRAPRRARYCTARSRVIASCPSSEQYSRQVPGVTGTVFVAPPCSPTASLTISAGRPDAAGGAIQRLCSLTS